MDIEKNAVLLVIGHRRTKRNGRSVIGSAEQSRRGEEYRAPAASLARERSAHHPRAARLDRRQLTVSARPARERGQTGGATTPRRTGGPQVREQRFHRYRPGTEITPGESANVIAVRAFAATI